MTLLTKVAASSRCFALASFAFRAVAPLAAEEPLPVVVISIPLPAHAPAAAHNSETVFAGQVHRTEWAIRSIDERSGTPRLSLYRVLSSTVAPVEENTVLARDLRLRPGQTSVIGYEFDIPDASAPVRYLAKLWFESGGAVKLAATTEILAVPESLLSQHRGQRALLCGFGSDGDASRTFLESFGWVVAISDSVPAATESGIVIIAPDLEAPSSDHRPTLVYRDLGLAGDSPAGVVTIMGDRGDGKAVRFEIPRDRWASLPHSAASQLLLSEVLATLETVL